MMLKNSMTAIHCSIPIYTNKNNTKASSIIEYSVLIVIIVSGLYMMKGIVSSGIFGHHKQAGDSFSFGRQYDPKRTTICRQDVINYEINGTPNLGAFYDEACYQTRVRRPVKVSATAVVSGGFDIQSGGCPYCQPGDDDSANCYKCEDALKAQCASNYCQY